MHLEPPRKTLRFGIPLKAPRKTLRYARKRRTNWLAEFPFFPRFWAFLVCRIWGFMSLEISGDLLLGELDVFANFLEWRIPPDDMEAVGR